MPDGWMEQGHFSIKVFDVPWNWAKNWSNVALDGVAIDLKPDKSKRYILAEYELSGPSRDEVSRHAAEIHNLLLHHLVVERGFGAKICGGGESWLLPDGRREVTGTFPMRHSILPAGFDWLPPPLTDQQRLRFSERMRSESILRRVWTYFVDGEGAFRDSLFRPAMWFYALSIEGLYRLTDDFKNRKKRRKWEKMVEVLAQESGYDMSVNPAKQSKPLDVKEVANARLEVSHFTPDDRASSFLSAVIVARHLVRMGIRREAAR